MMDPDQVSALLHLGAGAAVLFFGRKLFWLFVGLAGFTAAAAFVPLLLADAPPWLAIGVGLLLGAIGAHLAIKLQYVAAALAGMLVGSSIGTTIVADLSLQNPWLVVAVAGGLGAALMVLAFQPALMLLSALVGAFAVLTAAFTLVPFEVEPALQGFAWVALAAVGLTAQVRRRKR